MTEYSPISFNAHLGYCDFDQLLKDIELIKPYTMTSFIDKDSDAWKLDRLDQTGVRQVVRFFDNDDSRFHNLGADKGWVMSPDTFLAKYQQYGGPNRWLQVMNEPDGYSFNIRFLTWMQDVVTKTSVPLAIPGFGVGHPADSNNRWAGSWNELCKIIRAPNILSVHEYKPDLFPYRIGRFTMYHNSCASLTPPITPVPFVVTEWGYDSLGGGDPLNGWRSRGITESQLYLDLAATYFSYYEEYVKRGLCLGLHIFSYGDSGGWGNFRVDNARQFISNLENSTIRFVPGGIVNYPPLIGLNDPRWQTREVNAGAGVNIRPVPSSAGNSPIATLKGDNNLVKLFFDGLADPWIQIQLADGTIGWIHSGYLEIRERWEPIKLTFFSPEDQDRTVAFLRNNLNFFGIEEITG